MSAQRLRVLLLAVAALLLVPVALLVHRALRGAEAEAVARHRAVAERLFDEMERELSALVTREEARPVEAWRAGDPAALAALPPEAFVLGYFAIEPGGRVVAPVPPRDPEALAAVERWLTARDVRADTAPVQAPGTTVALAHDAAKPLRALGYAEGGDASERGQSPRASAPKDAYDALQSLNRGAEPRAQRERKLIAPKRESEPDGKLGSQAGSEGPPRAAAAPEAQTAERRDAAAVAVDPLVGRLADAQRLLLYRSVFAGSSATRQGLVLDVDGLGAHLRARTLGASGLAGVTLAFASGGAGAKAAAAGGDEQRYRHRFAEPFDALSAELALAPLDGGRDAGAIWALAALVVALGAAGLFAVYRMVIVAMAYAERRNNFVAAVTHELKTPLTAIRMYGEMLRDDLVPGEDKRREYYGTITAESERLSRLIDNVLEFSRLEKGTREMRLVAGAIGPVVEEVASLLAPHAARQRFALRTRIEPDLPPVRFERDALLQVLVNLVDNALKYARDAASREIAIECRREGAGVVIGVRDHGPGVAGRHVGRIFEPFHRGEDELTRTTQGTGLGLALVKSLVERMGGSVRGDNAPGGGFLVRVALPAD